MKLGNFLSSVLALAGLAAVISPAQAQGVLLDTGTISGTLVGYAKDTTASPTPPAGLMYSYVISGDTANPFVGGLTFAFQLNETGDTSTKGIVKDFDALNAYGYGIQNGGVTTFMSYADSLNLTTSASLDNESPDSSAPVYHNNQGMNAPYTGAVISNGLDATDGRQFSGFKLAVGGFTKYLIIRTDATAFQVFANAGVNGGAHSTTSFGPNVSAANPKGPMAFAPEPSTVAAFGFVGLGVVALAFRARRGKVQLAM